MRRKINISLLFASISLVLTLVFANVSWGFSDYKYSSSFLPVTSATAAEEPVAQIIVAQGDDDTCEEADSTDDSICEYDSNKLNCDGRSPNDIKIISPKHNCTVNRLTSKISWKAVPEVKAYYIKIKDITEDEWRFDETFTEDKDSKSAEGQITINYFFKDLDLIIGRNYRLIIEAVTESSLKPQGAIEFKVGKENS
ncbi:MAG: hypothetical protein QNJ47_03950 [Nostocaceae cyanobacterium]|nr:hypothetical protein [Nostocaceae cyanobacterium]